jgi:hypothetical protein
MKTDITVLIICCLVLIRIRNISEHSCRGNQNTHFMSNNIFFSKSCPFFMRQGGITIVQWGRPQMTIWHIASWVPRVSKTQSYCWLISVSTTTMVARHRLSVALYLYYLPCFPGIHSTGRLKFLVEAYCIACELTDLTLCIYPRTFRSSKG